MDYQELKADRKAAILRERLAQLEEHHYRVTLDLQDAEAVGDDALQVSSKTRLDVVNTQISNSLALLAELETKKGRKSK